MKEEMSKGVQLTEGVHSERQEHNLIVKDVLNALFVGHGLVAFVSASQLSPSALKVGPSKCFDGKFGLGFRGALWTRCDCDINGEEGHWLVRLGGERGWLDGASDISRAEVRKVGEEVRPRVMACLEWVNPASGARILTIV